MKSRFMKAEGVVRHDVIPGPISDHRQHSAKHYSHESADVVWVPILETAIQALSSFETEAVCRLIRRRWLHARILVVSAVESNLEDALYDDRVAPSVSSDVLFTTIERLAGGMHA